MKRINVGGLLNHIAGGHVASNVADAIRGLIENTHELTTERDKALTAARMLWSAHYGCELSDMRTATLEATKWVLDADDAEGGAK